MIEFIKGHISYIKQFFEDSNGNPSMMRKMSFVIVVSTLVYMFTIKEMTMVHVGLITSLITLGLGGKLMQKKVENK